MLTNLVSLITKSLSATPQITSTGAMTAQKQASQRENNPFLSSTYGSSSSYGKNQPVAGGYFAGYYNGKPNIVGRKLFIEI